MRARVIAAAAIVGLALPAHGALPPGFGGALRVSGTARVRVPDPTQVRTPLEATIAHAVFDTLYEVRGTTVAPLLAATMPELEDDVAVIRLRRGVRRHDRRSLTASDVARSLRRLERTPAQPWLEGFARRSGRLDVSTPDDVTLRIRLEDPTMDVARRLAATPLAIRLATGTGTGPFRARVRGDSLRLYQFRPAARGAPYLRSVHVSAPRDRDSELRSFDLGELDVSWRGASLYGQPGRTVARHDLPSRTSVLLVPHRSQRDRLGAIARVLDRRRIARVGITPSERLSASLPPPVTRGRRTGALRLMIVDGDQFQDELAAALAARFDELGWRTTVLRKDPERYDQLVPEDQWDLRIVQVPPPLPDDAAVLAAAWIAVGDGERARRVLRGARDPAVVQSAARELPAIVLGQRRRVMHHLPELMGVGHDALGRLRLGELHRPRENEGDGE